MAFALPVWLALQEELLRHSESDSDTRSCFDDLDDDALFQMFHLTRPCLTFITDAVRSRMKTQPQLKPELPLDAMVMLALNYYAHGISSAAVLQRVGLSQMDQAAAAIAAVSGIIAGMSEQFVSFPLTPDAKANVAVKIKELCGIPNVLGILAPAHFKIRASPYERSSFRSFVNTLGYTSVVSQIICDSEGNVLSVERCCVGSTGEQEMWESSDKGREIEKELLGQFWVIGGRGYHLSKNVLPPLAAPATDSENRFNEAHAKILNVMRKTLGSMKRRFRCLMQLGFAKEATLNKKSNIIKTCCVLHNIAMKFSVPPPPAAGKIEPLHQGRQLAATGEVNTEVLQARQKVIESSFSLPSSSSDPPGDNPTEEKE
ncbi:putative nuclease HARBI1 [Paralichthys olivaceus]|uniref:putative nuclease HARBI1 n=1 Tax=Paralichthys olivaceus TaxID=8255 RepID=UPI00097DCC41|nr:PREDICTED: putative nuclease HARBI1 [Paralichthys olivaceus]